MCFWESNPTNIKPPVFRSFPRQIKDFVGKPWCTHGDNGQFSSIHGHDLPEPWGGFDNPWAWFAQTIGWLRRFMGMIYPNHEYFCQTMGFTCQIL
jgi:hypothetical protein